MDAQHPWLLYYRYRLRLCTKKYLILPAHDEELKFISSFVNSALDELIKLKDMEDANAFDIHKALCSQMAFELGEYYFIIEDYEKSSFYLGLCYSISISNSLPVDVLSSWTDIDFDELHILQSVCDDLRSSKSNHSTEPADIFTLLSMYDSCKEYHAHIFEFFENDIVLKSIPNYVKEQFAQNALLNGYHELGLWILFCNAFSEATIETSTFESMKRRFLKGTTHFSDITTQLIIRVLGVPAKIIRSKEFPVNMIEEWRLRVQVFLFDISENVTQSTKIEIEASSKICVTIGFMSDFYSRYPLLKECTRSQWRIVQLLLNNTLGPLFSSRSI